jgi:hypothetical protein
MTYELAGYSSEPCSARGMEGSSVLVPQPFRDAREVESIQGDALLGLFRIVSQKRSRTSGTHGPP